MSNSTGCSKTATVMFVLVCVLGWSAITLVFDVIWASGVYQQLSALGYPTTEGIVTDSKVVSSRGSHGRTTTAPKITYSYQVAGTKYVSDRYRYRQFSSTDGNAARIAAQHPVGRRVTVHYSSTDPGDAVLLTGIEGSDLFLPIFMTPFNAVMLAFWVGSAMAIRNWGRPPVAGGVQFWDDGYQLRVRLPRYAAWVAGLLWLAVPSFALTFIVGFSSGFHPSLELMEVVWSLLLIVALTAYLRVKLRLVSGRADLVVDDLNGAVTLPLTFGRKEPRALTADQLRSLLVDDVARRGSKGSTSHTYVPTLFWQERNGVEHREKLGEWTNQARAESFATWLRERLKLNAVNPNVETAV
jgi:hypothetical protein